MAELKDVTIQKWFCSEPGCDENFDFESSIIIHELEHIQEHCQHPEHYFALVSDEEIGKYCHICSYHEYREVDTAYVNTFLQELWNNSKGKE